MSELVWYICALGVAFPYARTGEDMHDSSHVAIKWHKWLDNPLCGAQQENPGYEYIDFEWTHLDLVRSTVSPEFYSLCGASQVHDVITIEVAGDTVAMNNRAFVRAVYLIAERAHGCIHSRDDQRVLEASECYQANRELIEKAFSGDVNAE